MRRVVALCALLWLLCSSAFAAEQRVALVIGNAAYRVDPLDNAVNDARLVASSLKQAGFDVTLADPAGPELYTAGSSGPAGAAGLLDRGAKWRTL